MRTSIPQANHGRGCRGSEGGQTINKRIQEHANSKRARRLGGALVSIPRQALSSQTISRGSLGLSSQPTTINVNVLLPTLLTFRGAAALPRIIPYWTKIALW